jgi:hypothetical protein
MQKPRGEELTEDEVHGWDGDRIPPSHWPYRSPTPPARKRRTGKTVKFVPDTPSDEEKDAEDTYFDPYNF